MRGLRHDGRVEAVVVSLLAASVAIGVAVFERYRVAQEERRKWERTERRQIYGRFLGSVYLLGKADAVGNEAQVAVQADALGVAYSELELVAGDEVGPVAMEMVQLSFGADPSADVAARMGELRVRFALAARHELGTDRDRDAAPVRALRLTRCLGQHGRKR